MFEIYQARFGINNNNEIKTRIEKRHYQQNQKYQFEKNTNKTKSDVEDNKDDSKEKKRTDSLRTIYFINIDYFLIVFSDDASLGTKTWMNCCSISLAVDYSWLL